MIDNTTSLIKVLQNAVIFFFYPNPDRLYIFKQANIGFLHVSHLSLDLSLFCTFVTPTCIRFGTFTVPMAKRFRIFSSHFSFT